MYSSYHEELARRLAAQAWNDDEARHLTIDFKLVNAIARKFLPYVAAVEPEPAPSEPVEEVKSFPVELVNGETVMVTPPTQDTTSDTPVVDPQAATESEDLSAPN